MSYELHNADALKWLKSRSPNSVHAVVTDPPYGLVEYTPTELEKLASGAGGIWRIPRSHNGTTRSPSPRFTVLGPDEHRAILLFFRRFGHELLRVVVPGAHVFVASNPLLSHLVCQGMLASGFERRGEIARLVRTLRGGERPKNAEEAFPTVSVMPRSCWEPWELFRKPCEGRIQDNLRKWGTGGLLRTVDRPFLDVIPSGFPTRAERAIAPHPSMKPQAFLRQVVEASLPLGTGTILDPFMGSGSTIAAAEACGLNSIGIEVNDGYFKMAQRAVPLLATLSLAPREKVPTAAQRTPTVIPAAV